MNIDKLINHFLNEGDKDDLLSRFPSHDNESPHYLNAGSKKKEHSPEELAAAKKELETNTALNVQIKAETMKHLDTVKADVEKSKGKSIQAVPVKTSHFNPSIAPHDPVMTPVSSSPRMAFKPAEKEGELGTMVPDTKTFSPETFLTVKQTMKDAEALSVEAGKTSSAERRKARQAGLHYHKNAQEKTAKEISAARSEGPPRKNPITGEIGLWGDVSQANRKELIRRGTLPPSTRAQAKIVGTKLKDASSAEQKTASKLDIKTAEIFGSGKYARGKTGGTPPSEKMTPAAALDRHMGAKGGQSTKDLEVPKGAQKKIAALSQKKADTDIEKEATAVAKADLAKRHKSQGESIDAMINNILEISGEQGGGPYRRPAKGTEKRYTGFVTNKAGKTTFVVNKKENPGGNLFRQQFLSRSDFSPSVPTEPKKGPTMTGWKRGQLFTDTAGGGGKATSGQKTRSDAGAKEAKQNAAEAGKTLDKIIAAPGDVDLSVIAAKLGINTPKKKRDTLTPRQFANKATDRSNVNDYYKAGEDTPIGNWSKKGEELIKIVNRYIIEITTPSLGLIKFGPRATMPNREPLSTENHPASVGKRRSGFKPTVEVSGRKEEAEKQLDTLFPAFRPERKKPMAGRDAFNNLFPTQEDNMKKNTDKLADKLIAEAFTSGPNNVSKGNDNSGKGQTSRQMLAGEFFGSTAWPYQEPDNKDLAGSTKLLNSQAEEGLGELVPLSTRVAEAVDEMLEDCPSSIYTDPESVGYLINALSEEGFTEFSEAIEEITASPADEDVARLTEMAKVLQEKKADTFLVEQVNGLSLLVQQLLTEEEQEIATAGEEGGDAAGSGTPETDAGMDKPAETPGTAD